MHLLTVVSSLVLLVSTNAAVLNCSSDQTEEMRKEFRSYHNLIRRYISYGIEPLESGTLGPAKNMHRLRWSCPLETLALSIVSDCKMNPVNGYSQNIKKFMYTGEDIYAARFAQETWRMQPMAFGFDPKTNKAKPTIREFANMAYEKNTALGCAYKKCDGGYYAAVACVYEKGISDDYQAIWENGNSCTCDAYRSQKCINDLCAG